MKDQVVMLKDLKAGEMFKRSSGDYRYVVSNQWDEHCGNVSIYCYNLDGESEGYWHAGSEKVLRLDSYGGTKQSCLSCFWMCWVEGSGSPKVKHCTSAKATSEAERLASSTGKPVYILKATHLVVSEPEGGIWLSNLN